jgi:hypothetical protein
MESGAAHRRAAPISARVPHNAPPMDQSVLPFIGAQWRARVRPRHGCETRTGSFHIMWWALCVLR